MYFMATGYKNKHCFWSVFYSRRSQERRHYITTLLIYNLNNSSLTVSFKNFYKIWRERTRRPRYMLHRCETCETARRDRVLSRIYRLGAKFRKAKGHELPRGIPQKLFVMNMRWDAIWCTLIHNFEKCYSGILFYFLVVIMFLVIQCP